MSAKLFPAFLGVCLLLNVSCASLLKGTSDTLYVRSEVVGTKLYFHETFLGIDEGEFELPKKKLKGARLLAVKEGCQTASVEVKSKFDGTSLLGFFIDFGLISILVVDWGVNGAVREAEKLSYVVSPICGESK